MSVPTPPDSRPRRRPIDRLRRAVRTVALTGTVRLLAAAFALLPWRAAQATARPWLPELVQQTPAVRCSGESCAT